MKQKLIPSSLPQSQHRDNLVKTLFESFSSGGHATGVTPPPGEVNPPGSTPTPDARFAPIGLDGLFSSPSAFPVSLLVVQGADPRKLPIFQEHQEGSTAGGDVVDFV